MSDLIEEIKRDMSDEKYAQLFTKHGGKLIALGVGIVVIAAVNSVYQKISDRKSRESGTLFMQAFDQSNDPAKYDAVIAKGQKGYSPLAELMKAGLQNSKDNYSDALKTLQQISDNPSNERAFREKAMIDQAYIMIQQKADSKQILDLLEKTSQDNSVFRYTALELKGAYLLDSGDKQKATEIFSKIAQDEKSPSTIQERAKHVLATIK